MWSRCIRIALLLSALGVFAALSGCGASAPRVDFEAERRATSAYAVGPGDVLEVRAWKNEALSHRVTVRPDGFITVPLVGDIMASGRTVMGIAEEIATQAARFYHEKPVVSVEVAELHSYRVYVMGEVSRPGEFTPTAQVTVLQALALAGGFTRFADPDEVVIVRRDALGQRRIPFAFEQVVRKGDLRGDLPLQTNDTVVVP
ncbi:polysaccharide biosynthesis/export family protein [Sorangium sp. So ce1151]|uniref:polysaccharide biosynthesis/export family protein n=1 Tax=Sorangium sp. So ce1151 TaxID=3133332 RepID=UPI003F5F1CAF